MRAFWSLRFLMLLCFLGLALQGCGGGGGGGGGNDAALNPYFPSVVGYSWTYDVTPSTGTPYTQVSTVVSSSTSGFSVKSQNSNTASYGKTDFIHDGAALKYSTSYSYNNGALSSKNEFTPAALVLPSNMASNTTESTISASKTTSGTTVTTSSVVRSITVNGEESVTTPAGTFTATKLTLTVITTPSTGAAMTGTTTYWYVKNVGRVKYVSIYTNGATTTTTTSALKSYSQTPTTGGDDNIDICVGEVINPISLKIGVPLNQTIDSYGTKYYVFEAVEQATYTISLYNMVTDNDWELTEYISNCEDDYPSDPLIIAESDNDSLTPDIKVVTLSPKKYLLVVDEYDNEPSGYTVSVNKIAQ